MAPLLVVGSCGPRDDAAVEGDAADTTQAPAAGGVPAPEAPETPAPSGASETEAGGAEAAADAAGGPAGESGGSAAGAEAATEAGDVDWMRVDEGAKRVEFDIVAGLTPVSGNWNFNGYANGDMTITVPVGWTVVMNFTNQDANVPHSVYVLDREPPFPQVMPERPGIPRAYSINLMNGIAAGREDTLRFPVNQAGRYTMPCAVPGHAASGMWDWFVVSAEAARPSVSTTS